MSLLLIGPWASAQTTVINRASISPPAGVTNSGAACTPIPGVREFNPATGTCTGISTVSVTAGYDFCPVGAPAPIFSVVNSGVYRYDVGSGSDVLPPELAFAPSMTGLVTNALMVDPVRNRLLFISSGGGRPTTLWAFDQSHPTSPGWYEVTSSGVPDVPRAGMTQAGIGYLIGSGNNAPVYRVDPSGAFGYTITSVGSLTYSPAPTDTGSGDIAFDANGIAWLAVGEDLYTIDMTVLPLQAVRQTRPAGKPAGINWAGAAFASDGILYVADNSSSSRYYAYNPLTGNLAAGPATTARASRDLASCGFPVPQDPELSVVKTLSEVNGAAYVAGTPVVPGDVLGYRIRISNSGGAVGTLFPNDVRETLPAGTQYVATGNDFTCTGSDCANTNAVNVPAGSHADLRFVVQVAAPPLPAGTNNIVNNVTVEGIDCSAAGNDCTETTPVGPAVSLAKSGPAMVLVGESFKYTLTVTNSGGLATGTPVIVHDQLPADVVATAVLGADCGTLPSAPGALLACNIAAPVAANGGTASFELTVTAPATSGSIINHASTSTTGGGDPTTPPGSGCVSNASTSCAQAPTEVQAPGLSIVKSVTSSGPYVLNSTIAYSFLVTNTGTVPLTDVVVTDTLPNLSAISCPSTTLALGADMTCTATYVVTQADVNAGNVHNSATASGTPPVTDPSNPPTPITTPPSEIDTPITQTPGLSIVKSVTSSGPYAVGSVIDYQFVVTNNGNVALMGVSVVDTLVGLSPITYDWPGVAGELLAGQSVTATASYTVTQADVNAGNVYNTATAVGMPPVTNPSNPPPPLTTPPSDTDTQILQSPAISVTKQAVLTTDNGTAGAGNIGDVITYTVTVTNTGNVPLTDITVLDSFQGGAPVALTCAPTTLAVGETALCDQYTHTITLEEVNAGVALENVVDASGVFAGATGTVTVTGNSSALIDVETDPHAIRLSKSVSVREVNIGDLVRYTLTVENVGTTHLVNGYVVDTPPAGFTYVEGSLSVADGDNAATVSGQHPLRFEGVDVAVGQSATLTYLMRVGAGVRPGSHQNQAQVFSGEGDPISNIATAEVDLVSDPLLDDSLIFGTVFDDRDGDGWQDSAALSGVQVQGGFAPGAYVANSTTVDRGAGPQPEADASSPLLHGIAVGGITGRQSQADPATRHQVVIRQRLSELAFTNDFVLTNHQGVTVRMDAEGNTTVETSGEAAKGLTAAQPTVERRVAVVEGGYVVDYVIRNQGIDERGIPGVRIASVEGLLIETDQFGRYHLAGVDGGNWARGRNFILKVDPSTLPAGAELTTDNPLLRRVTPGLPVRFDWGVKLPVVPLEGKEQAELELGEVIFAPGSADVRTEYLEVIGAIAAKIDQYHGGEVLIRANGHTDALALARAEAVKQVLLQRVSADSLPGLVVSVRGDPGDPGSMVIGVDEGGYVLGHVLFDTDKSAIRPEFGPLLDQMAQALDRRGEGVVTLIGHTDVRGSHAYNTALGLRRAKAVQEALAQRLSPEVRARVRVDVSNDPTAAVGMKR